ncbi:hypothetical protein BDF14DRAFT_1779432 [Spinellus fusiger]|nr:hypothetical protein BDF14DRAFT_1779432 [Spinellus fusiger]
MKINCAIIVAALSLQCTALAHASNGPKYTVVDSPPLPCNGYPEQCSLRANGFFYLGTRLNTSPSTPSNHHCPVTQSRSVTEILDKGIQLLEISLCKGSNEKALLCSDATDEKEKKPLLDIVDEVFEYIQTRPQQVIVIHFSSDVPEEKRPTVKAIEDAIDTVCKTHSARTEGINIFKPRKCEFIHVQKESEPIWSEMRKLVTYYPEMSQWEGDGDHVGIRGRVIFTYDEDFKSEGTTSAYLSNAFWKTSFVPGQKPEEIQKHLHALCKETGAISIKAYSDPTAAVCTSDKLNDPNYLDELVIGTNACDYNKADTQTYFASIVVDDYEKHLPYLKDLQSRMVDINLAKWEHEPTQFKRSGLLAEKKNTPPQYERYEL